MADKPKFKLVKPKTQRGKRALQKREPKLIEDSKTALLLYGNKTSQVLKDVLTDFHKLKALDAIKYTRKNAEVRPFEPGGETSLERFSQKTDSSLFVLGTHSKKRPHNLTLGRFYDHRLYDMVEFGVDEYKNITSFGSAGASVQVGNKPFFVFVGEQFESSKELAMAKSLLLDFFRGRQVDGLNLKGVDHVMFVTAVEKRLLIRQYRIRLKKSGTKIPNVELAEMGPRMDLTIRRVREPPLDLQKEANKQPKLTAKKVKNVSTESLAGKVGRIYMPKQDLGSIALAKPKGVKRERQQSASEAAEAKKLDAAKKARLAGLS